MSGPRFISKHGVSITIVLSLMTALFAGLAVPGGVLAHAPSSVTSTYDYSKQELSVSISHTVSDNTTHYVYQVQLYRNNVLNVTYSYSDQPTTSSFTYKYSISAKDQDVLKATASCNQGGSTSGSVTVIAPKLPLAISYYPKPKYVNEGTTTRFNLNITSTGTPVGGLTVTATASLGTISSLTTVSAGNHSFDFTAPQTSTQTNVRINVSAVKTGYQRTYLNIDLKVNNTTPPPPGQISVILQPIITEMDEESLQSFKVVVREAGKFLSGAEVNVTAGKGFVTNLTNKMDGNATFNYTSPHVDSDTSDILRIRATKSGYKPGYSNITIMINNRPEGPQPTLDGSIIAGEYSDMQVLEEGTFSVHWRFAEDHIHLALEARTTGWAAIGFEPTVGMKDADMLLGWVSYEGVKVFDAYATGENGPHPPDESLGGTYDILEFGGSEADGWTVLEFIRAIDTGDDLDLVMPTEGAVDVIWAISQDDDLSSGHLSRGSAVLDLGSFPTDPRWVEDGAVSAGEYGNTSSFGAGQFELFWRVDGDRLMMAMIGATLGWVSIGFEPAYAMLEADMVFGWLTEGTVSIVDAYSTGANGPHPADLDLGGTDDIITFGGSESGGRTTIEFSRNLSTGDAYDKQVPFPGTLTFIWALGFEDSFLSVHSSRGAGTIELVLDGEEPPVNETDPRQVLDGRIVDGEYKYNISFQDGEMRVHWGFGNGTLRIALDGNTTGWVAIGFEPSQGMMDSDMLFGSVADGNISVMDAYSTGINGPHPPDNDLGGADDILFFGGREEGGRTIVEFVRNLTTGESYDFIFPMEGNVTVIWALGLDDDFASSHSSRGSGVLDMSVPPIEPPEDPRLKLDGVLTEGEYDRNQSFGGGDLWLHWKVEGERVRFGMAGNSTGWVAVGFKPSTAMKDADMVLGFVSSGGLTIVDAFSTGVNGPHPTDKVLGGTDDLIEYGGREEGGRTVIEFVRNLTSNDLYDQDLGLNETMKVIWAISEQDDLTASHLRRGSGTFRLLPEEEPPGPVPTLDGVIGSSEYAFTKDLDAGNYSLYWSFSGAVLKVGIRARTTGWVGVGFEPTSKMRDADMIIGWVDAAGDIFVIDAYSTGENGPHPADTALGGTYDIIEFGGKEEGGWTTIEFTRNATAADTFDRTVPSDNTARIIWAYGASDDLAQGHDLVRRGSGTMGFGSEGGDDEDGFPIWSILIVIVVVLVVIAIIVLLAVRGRKGEKEQQAPTGTVEAGEAPEAGKETEKVQEE